MVPASNQNKSKVDQLARQLELHIFKESESRDEYLKKIGDHMRSIQQRAVNSGQSPMLQTQAGPHMNQFNNSMNNPNGIQQGGSPELQNGANTSIIHGTATAEVKSETTTPISQIAGGQGQAPQASSSSPMTASQQPSGSNHDDQGQTRPGQETHATIAGMRVTVLNLTPSEKEAVVQRVYTAKVVGAD